MEASLKPMTQAILLSAKTIESLKKRIDEVFRYRSRSVKDRSEWERVCKEFRGYYDDHFYPGGASRWGLLRAGDSSEFDTAIAFLSADPWYFRSGYMKEEIWRVLKRAPLSSKQERALEAIAEEYLDKPLRREFWIMARYVRIRGSDGFWSRIETAARSREQTFKRTKAEWLWLRYMNKASSPDAAQRNPGQADGQ